MDRTILSLCDYTGNWPRPYLEAGYRVVLVDPKHKTSSISDGLYKIATTVEDLVFLKDHSLLKLLTSFTIHGIMMAPPCTHFSASGAQYWKRKDADGRTLAARALIRVCLEIKDFLQPSWWVLENPVGRLPTLFPDALGRPKMYFTPCDYGDPYTKKTGLWGK